MSITIGSIVTVYYGRALNHSNLSDFVLETLEYKLSLLVFVLPNAVLRLQLVKFHSFRVLELAVLRMEHMRTQV